MQKEGKTSGTNGQLLKSTKISETKELGEGWPQPGSLSGPVADNVFIDNNHL